VKVGDLVTLSEYGTNLEALWYVTDPARKGELVGMVVEIFESDKPWESGTWYQIRWMGTKYKNLCRGRWHRPGRFRRKDLKMYKKPKNKGD
jgi:hypothetical protein